MRWFLDLFEDPPWFEKWNVEALITILTIITIGWLFAAK